MTIYFVHTGTEKRFDIVSFDKDNGTVRLKGPHGREFVEKFNPERFKELGYELRKED